uniref:Secreted protein n=1 Tax=Romanomermis culicivorax TaxID=13658 RepID=A0A915IYI0_ROMCU
MKVCAAVAYCYCFSLIFYKNKNKQKSSIEESLQSSSTQELFQLGNLKSKKENKLSTKHHRKWTFYAIMPKM